MSSYNLPTGEQDKSRLDMQAAATEKTLRVHLQTFNFNFNDKILLDFGCGVASARNILLDMYPGVKYVGLDQNAQSLASCRQNYPHDEFILGDENSDVIPRADVIFIKAVVMHQDDPAAFLEKLANRMKPNSVLIIFEPTSDAAKASCLPLRKLMELRLKLGERDSHDWNGARHIAQILQEKNKHFTQISEDIIDIDNLPLGSIRNFIMKTFESMAHMMPEYADEIAAYSAMVSNYNDEAPQYFGTYYLVVGW